MIIYHDTTSLAEMLQSACMDHDGEFNPEAWAEYLDAHQDAPGVTVQVRHEDGTFRAVLHREATFWEVEGDGTLTVLVDDLNTVAVYASGVWASAHLGDRTGDAL